MFVCVVGDVWCRGLCVREKGQALIGVRPVLFKSRNLSAAVSARRPGNFSARARGDNTTPCAAPLLHKHMRRAEQLILSALCVCAFCLIWPVIGAPVPARETVADVRRADPAHRAGRQWHR